MADEHSPLPEFFQLLDLTSMRLREGKCQRHDVVNLIDFIREYDTLILAKLDEQR